MEVGKTALQGAQKRPRRLAGEVDRRLTEKCERAEELQQCLSPTHGSVCRNQGRSLELPAWQLAQRGREEAGVEKHGEGEDDGNKDAGAWELGELVSCGILARLDGDVFKKKILLCRLTIRGIVFNKKILLCRFRKSSNPCPILTQRRITA